MAAGTARQKQVEASMQVALGDIAVVAEKWADAIDVVGYHHTHHLQLSLCATDFEAAGCYTERWAPRRFGRIGPLFLLPAHQPIRARSTCRSQRSIICRLNPDALSNWFDRDMEWTDRRLEGSLDISSPTLRLLMHRVSDELRNPGFGREAMLELLVAEIGIELSRYFLGLEERATSGGLAPWRLRRIDEYLADDAACATLGDLARLCNLSVRHLARAFRISRGCSLGDYIAARRIEQARQMLASGLSVKETAFAVGFTAPTNFSAAFRRATGESPSEFKQRSRRA